MRKVLGGTLLLCVVCVAALAVPIVTPFMDTDIFVESAKDIVVAECTLSPAQSAAGGGLRVVKLNIRKVLKGSAKPGPLRVATIHAIELHTTYMLCSLGGNALGTDFLAVPELSVVPLPEAFELHELNDKDLKEQVQYMFSLRLFEVERKLRPLLKEKELLEKGVSDRRYEWFESDGPVKLGAIIEGSTQADETGKWVWLDLEGQRIEWSHSSPGTSGFFYFKKVGAYRRTPHWEFAPCDASKIEDLAGKPLKAKFYGMYTPGRADTAFGWTGPGSIRMRVGQVLLARTVNDARKVFIIQIVGQKQDQEQTSVRYTVIVH